MNDHAPTMIQSLVGQAATIAAEARGVLAPIADMKQQLRQRLLAEGNILTIPSTAVEPPVSMCAIDGARVTERLYSADLIAAVACTGEARSCQESGPSVARTWAHLYPHGTDIDRIAGAAMACLELEVAHNAPHQVRLLDGSFLTPIVEARKGLGSTVATVRNEVARLLTDAEFIAHLTALLTHDPERPVVALPKSETSTVWRDDVNAALGTSFTVTDRVLASQVLEPGEMLRPRPLTEWDQQQVVVREDAARPVADVARSLNATLNDVRQRVRDGRLVTTYIRPANGVGVIRAEFHSAGPDDTKTPYWVAQVLLAETAAPHMMEPFAQWSADRQAKGVSAGVRALLGAVQHELTAEERAQWGTLFASKYRT